MISVVKIQELKKLYERQSTKFEKHLASREPVEELSEGLQQAYWMTQGNKGMADMIITDLERLLQEEEEK